MRRVFFFFGGLFGGLGPFLALLQPAQEHGESYPDPIHIEACHFHGPVHGYLRKFALHEAVISVKMFGDTLQPL